MPQLKSISRRSDFINHINYIGLIYKLNFEHSFGIKSFPEICSLDRHHHLASIDVHPEACIAE
ncbi:uncharacterized protein M6B38_182635 [Iris pallida]|uniref:Uncharacterized protein n=1 Tax=Iris pallida TaxID=29817 RepID=A0AAX6EL49_IRIPA|nr:uncharacterized protein M6B38_182635 [Iris pallida]